MPPTPASSCLDILKTVVESLGNTFGVLSKHSQYQSLPQHNILSSAILLLSTDPTKLNEPSKHLKAFFLSETPLGQANILTALEGLLAADPHIKATCRSAWGLARAIEELVSDFPRQLSGSSKENVYANGSLATYVLNRLFESEYHRQGLFHVYNLQAETPPPLEVPIYSAQIRTLRDDEIPLLIGETTAYSSLHYPGTGNNFISFVDSGPENDVEWMQKRWHDAWLITRLLKYMKYGIVDTDYAGIYYSPPWMNRVWKSGVYLWGRPRWDCQIKPYHLTKADANTFIQYINTERKLGPILSSTCSLRKATEFAGNYYQSHHGRISKEDQLIDLTIALEALFSPSNQGELQFRMAQRMATLLGETAPKRKEIFKLGKKVYEARSRFVHGGGSPFEPGNLTPDDLEKFGDYIRQAILKLIILIARGEQEKKNADTLMDEAALDGASLEMLHAKTHFDSFLKEYASAE